MSTNNERITNETCPEMGIFYTHNVKGRTGKDKGLESLVDPIVDLMIKHNIMVYCIQETWTWDQVVTYCEDTWLYETTEKKVS